MAQCLLYRTIACFIARFKGRVVAEPRPVCMF